MSESKNKRPAPSRFTAILQRMIDESGFGRGDWVRILAVSPSAISQWIAGDTIPRPEALRVIVEVLQTTDDVSPEILEEFWRMAAEPAAETVGRDNGRIGATVGDYFVRPAMEGFLRNWTPLSAQEKERVLVRAAALCRDFQTVHVGDARVHVTPSLEEFVRALALLPLQRQEDVCTEAAKLCRDEFRQPQPTETADLLREQTTPSVWFVSGTKIEEMCVRRGPRGVVGPSGIIHEPAKITGTFHLGQTDSPWWVSFLTVCDATQERLHGLSANEIALIPLQGTTEVNVGGGNQPYTLAAKGSKRAVLTVAAKNLDETLPDLSVRSVGNDRSVVMSIIFSRAGAPLHGRVGEKVSMPLTRERRVAKNWVAHTASLPDSAQAAAAYLNQHRRRPKKEYHQEARGLGQLQDADLIAGRYFTVRLLGFPWTPQPDHFEGLSMDHHSGHEVFVPLFGRTVAVTAALTGAKQDYGSLQMSDFEPWEVELTRIECADPVETTFPDVLFLRSSAAHAFYAIGQEPAYNLHIRLTDDGLAPLANVEETDEVNGWSESR